MSGIMRNPPPMPASEPHKPAIVPIMKDFGGIELSPDGGFFET